MENSKFYIINKTIMNQVIISKQLTDIEIYKKISKRIIKIKQVDIHFQNFLVESHKNYDQFANKYKQECQNFDQSLIQSNFYSSTKCLEILTFTNLFKQLALSIKKMARIILISLKKFQNDQSDKLEKLFQTKLSEFFNILSGYQKQSKKMEKLKQSYSNKCRILNQTIQKFKQYKDPHSFYNPVISEQFSKQLDDKYKIALTKQSLVKEQLQKIKQNKRKLQFSMKELKESLVTVFKYHITKMCDMVRIVLEDSQREAVIIKQIDKAGVIQQFCQSQFVRLKEYYQNNGNDKKKMVEQNQSDYQNPFAEVQTNQMNTNHKFFLERCENFLRMKKKSIEYSNTFRVKSKEFLTKLIQQMRKMRKSHQQIKKTAFGNNKLETFKKDIRKFLGESMFNIFKLVNKLVERPEMTIGKIQKSISTKISKIDLILIEQNKIYQTFNNEMNHLFDDHKKIKQQIEGKFTVNREVYVQLKKNIDTTFQTFKEILSNFKQKEQKFHRYFIAEMHDIGCTIESQSFKKSLQQTLGDYKQLYDIFKTINIDSEVLKVMKEDKKYEIIFNSFFSEFSNHQFESMIQTPEYQKMKKILERKQGINRTIKGSYTIGCCGVVPKKSQFSGKEVFRYECSLYNKTLIEGQLNLQEGITFSSIKRGIFEQKIKIMIPKNDIKKIQKKDGLNIYTHGVSIFTTMGQIIFASFQNREVVMSNLINLFFHDRKQSSQVSQKQMSIRINSIESKANDKTGTQKNSNSKQISRKQTRDGTLTLNTLEKEISLLINKWQNENNFLSNSFVPAGLDKNLNTIKTVYNTKFNNIAIKIKQYKQISRNGNNMIVISYKWKLSFPCTQLMNSVIIDEKFTAEVIDKIININAVVKKYSISQSYLCDIFYKQIQEMNKKLSQFISDNITNDQCQLFPQIIYQQNKILEFNQLTTKKSSPQKKISIKEGTEKIIPQNILEQPSPKEQKIDPNIPQMNHKQKIQQKPKLNQNVKIMLGIIAILILLLSIYFS